MMDILLEIDHARELVTDKLLFHFGPHLNSN